MIRETKKKKLKDTLTKRYKKSSLENNSNSNGMILHMTVLLEIKLIKIKLYISI